MNQDMLILNYLKQGNSITQKEAIQLFHCYRLSAAIYRLRNSGYEIETHKQQKAMGSGTFARYIMKGVSR
ncbi:helix-turn-helix domain-containing protein [Acinetobacter sp. ANC 3813]|uniref:helix-turn-helix domain-containing protein n=1 Tax=Acinetobacter sp. ANC 3813 TaxID=1977873 RepID=UPI000A32CB2B|nr:helix-turn-helix domain-containing protein [Acinetobacter sp. ANC 3813]OTG86543.1 DNA-binding protein [Acinetobacter sp. ANC 3813]